MATTGIINTTLATIYRDGTKIGNATGASLSFNHSPRDTTNKDSGGWRALLEGLRTWSMSGSAYWAVDATEGYSELFNLNDATRTSATVRFETDVSGDDYYEGTGWLSVLDIDSSGAEDNVSFTFTFEGSGALAEATVT